MKHLLWSLMLLAVACGSGEKGKSADNSATSPKGRAGTAASQQEEAIAARLKAGRTLYEKKDYPGAMAEFEAALGIDAKDATVLNEIAYVAFMTADYAKAETSAKAAMDGASDNKLKAAAAYNLGRIAQVQGRLSDAKGFYEESLRLRPENKTVEYFDRAVDSLTPPCEGKVDTKEQTCWCLGYELSDGDTNTQSPTCSVSKKHKSPLGEVFELYTDGGDAGFEGSLWALVSRESAGYRPIAKLEQSGVHGEFLKLTGKVRTVGTKKLLELSFDTSRDLKHDLLFETRTLLCPLPLTVCTVAMQSSSRYEEEGTTPTVLEEWATKYSIAESGLVTVSPSKGKPPAIHLSAQRVW